MKPIFVTLPALVLLAAPLPPAQADRVDDYVRETMRRRHIPGVSLLVLKNGKVLKKKGYGVASVELNAPTTPETIYALASTTKPFIAMGILLLAEQGQLRLDDPISKFVENTPESWKPITLRHLLSQTSGIRDVGDLRMTFPHDTPAQKVVEAMAKEPLHFTPGAQWRYSNTGYVLLGMVLEKVTGKPWEEFLRERIFQPLAMTTTRRDGVDAVVPHRATGYLWWGGQLRNADFLKNDMPHHGDEGLISNVLDLAKWDAGLRSNAVLSKQSQEAMWSPMRLNDGTTAGYGLGWFLEMHNGHRNISHAGGNPGTAAQFSFYPDDGVTVILLANLFGPVHVQAFAQGVAQCYIPDMQPKGVFSLPQPTLTAYTGYYNIWGNQILKVRKESAKLVLDDNGNLANTLLPVSPTRFVAWDTDRGVTFQKSPDGALTALSLRLVNDEFPAPYLGPLIGAKPTSPDPDSARTRRIEAIIKALRRGVKKEDAEARELAPNTLDDFSHGPAPELEGIEGLVFDFEQPVLAGPVERHREKVARVLGFQTADKKRGLLVYLTADGRIADEDVVAL